MLAFSNTAHSPSVIALTKTESTHSKRLVPRLQIYTRGFSLSKIGACLLTKASTALSYAYMSRGFSLIVFSSFMIEEV